MHVPSLPFSPYNLPEVIYHLLGSQPTSPHYINMVKKTHPLNYSPIRLLGILSKFMESVVAVDIKSFRFSNNFISDHQFGLRSGHSTLNMLLLLTQQWMEALNIRHEIRVISLDISHAFGAI